MLRKRKAWAALVSLGGTIGIPTRTTGYSYILIVFLPVYLLAMLLLGNSVALLFSGLASVREFVTLARDGLSKSYAMPLHTPSFSALCWERPSLERVVGYVSGYCVAHEFGG